MARVAVCEDDRGLRGLLRRTLEGDGHSVVAAANGSDLLARLDPAPQIVILDIGLPDADGRDVCLPRLSMGLTGLRGRIVSLAILTATLVVAVLVVLSHVLLTRATDADTRTLARTRAEAVAGTVQVHNGTVRLVEGTGDAFDTVAWVYADGRLIDGVLHSTSAGVVDKLGRSGRDEFVTTGRYPLYAVPLPVQGHRVTIVVTVDLAPYENSEQRSLLMSLVLGALAIVLAGFVAYLGVSRALRVVHQMSAMADEWGDHDPVRRYGLGPARDEFGELAQTFDRLLGRVSDTIADERRLTDEIAHELRTPMTVLRGEAQLAELSGTQVDPQLVLAETDRLSTAVSGILDAARSRLRGEASCRLAAVLRQVAEGREVKIDAPRDLEVAVPADVVAAVLAPLLDNATRHARTTASLEAEAVGDSVLVHVLDDGPGFRPDDLERVFAPVTAARTGTGSASPWSVGSRPQPASAYGRWPTAADTSRFGSRGPDGSQVACRCFEQAWPA